MGTSTSKGTPDADGNIYSTLCSMPTMCGGTVFGEFDIEDLTIFLGVYEIPRLPPKFRREVLRVRSTYDLILRITSKIPGRKEDTCKLGFAMARRSIYSKSLDLSTFHTFKLFGNELEVGGLNIVGVADTGEVNKRLLGILYGLDSR